MIATILEALPVLLKIIPGLGDLFRALLDNDSDVKAEVEAILGDSVDALERKLKALQAPKP